MRNHFLAAAAAMLVAACNAPGARADASGVSGQRAFDVAAFDGIELAGPYDMVVSVGSAPSVRAEGDTGLIEQMDVRVENGSLRVGQRPGISWSGDKGRVTVYVTAPELRAAAISGSGDMRIGAVQAPRFAGSIGGSGNLLLERLETGAAEFSIAGSGDVRVSGQAREAKLDIAGSGNADLAGMQAEAAQVSIMGSGDAQLRATRTAAVRIMGSGNVNVTGGARCDVSKMGSGSVRCG